MTNNELLKIKNPKEKFYMLRKEIIGASCKETVKRGINVRKFVLSSLENDGFDLKDQGTQYLATLITLFYHERKMYRRKDIKDKSYWDLNDCTNEHFKMLGNTKENVLNTILSAIKKNDIENGPIDELVYEIYNYTAYHYNRDERREKYLKQLSK